MRDVNMDKKPCNENTNKSDKEFRLSKSKYCCGVQCSKMLWLKKNKPEEFDESVMNQAVLDNGNEVGDLAMGLLGEFSEVPFNDDLTLMLSETERLIKDGIENIAEASFSYDGLFCSVDILKNKGNGHVEIYEVKSSTEVKDIYKEDVSYQYYVLTKLGYQVDAVYLVYVNNQYVRHGDIDIHQLFSICDLSDFAKSHVDNVCAKINQLREYMKHEEEQHQPISESCFSPYECGFRHYCSAYLPQPNVFNLSIIQRKTKFKYLAQGKASYADVLSDPKLNVKARQQIVHELNDIPAEIDKPAINAFLQTLTYPLYFLDFESFNPAIPKYDNSRPYEQICFQYSLHYIEEEGGELKHTEFLAYPGEDPRRALCEQLCRDIPLGVCTLAYNMTFEKTRIKEMASLYPDLADHLMDIYNNVKDLMVPFQERKYYCRAMSGSYSIKYVLPALFPDDPSLDYHNLEGVHNGSEASATFLRMEQMNPQELEKYRGHLLKYCGLDTYAMVKVWEKLREVSNEK